MKHTTVTIICLLIALSAASLAWCAAKSTATTPHTPTTVDYLILTLNANYRIPILPYNMDNSFFSLDFCCYGKKDKLRIVCIHGKKVIADDMHRFVAMNKIIAEKTCQEFGLNLPVEIEYHQIGK